MLSVLDRQQLFTRLQQEEGLRLKPYKDENGHLTIGYGRNLDQDGIGPPEAEMLLQNDINVAQCGLDSRFDWFKMLDGVRAQAMVDIAFNLGIRGLMGFPKFLAAMGAHDYATAATELQNSKWFTEVGPRGVKLVSMIQTGQLPNS